MENLERLLRQHHFLEELTPEQIRFLVSCARNDRFGAGSFLFREGATARSFFLIRVGIVSLEVHVPGKGPLMMETASPGDIVGLSWLYPPHLSQLDARAVDDVIAIVFDGDCLRGKMAEDPALGYALTRRLLFQVYKRLERVRLQRFDLYKSE